MKDRQSRTGLVTPQLGNGAQLPLISPQPQIQQPQALLQNQLTPSQIPRQVTQLTQQQLAVCTLQ